MNKRLFSAAESYFTEAFPISETDGEHDIQETQSLIPYSY